VIVLHALGPLHVQPVRTHLSLDRCTCVAHVQICTCAKCSGSSTATCRDTAASLKSVAYPRQVEQAEEVAACVGCRPMRVLGRSASRSSSQRPSSQVQSVLSLQPGDSLGFLRCVRCRAPRSSITLPARVQAPGINAAGVSGGDVPVVCRADPRLRSVHFPRACRPSWRPSTSCARC
jgi:hypothetical protein